jgi:uridine kinase
MNKTRTHPLLVGIAGGSCSGKTTLVHTLTEKLGAQHITTIKHDSYYRDQATLHPHERRNTNYDHPDALETTLLIEHLVALRNGADAQIPEYDFANHTRSHTTITAHPSAIIIIEGILIYSVPTLRTMFDLGIYVHTDADIRLARRISRDVAERGRSVDSVLKQYLTTVRQGHTKFVEPSRVCAELVISGEYSTDLYATRIVTMINQLLRRTQ